VNAYNNAGVDVEKASAFVHNIGNINTAEFAATVKVGGENVVLAVDGVGTKILVAEELGIFNTIGIDLVAMCVNDLLCKGAKPVAFLDYYATGHLSLDKSIQIMDGIKEGCRIAGCELVGGETAEMPGMYDGKKFDLAGFAVGSIIKRSSVTGTEGLPRTNMIYAGDLLVGIPSSGPHSNGFSLLRKHMKATKELLTPTKIYVKEVIENYWSIKAAAHITGGGLEHNIDRVVPEHLTYRLEFELNDFWKRVQKECSLSTPELESIFNCGWGMVLVIDERSLYSLQQNISDIKVLGVLEKQ
jgi:phosphoribosylformylglycinamidine cyclo-ligase